MQDNLLGTCRVDSVKKLSKIKYNLMILLGLPVEQDHWAIKEVMVKSQRHKITTIPISNSRDKTISNTVKVSRHTDKAKLEWDLVFDLNIVK